MNNVKDPRVADDEFSMNLATDLLQLVFKTIEKSSLTRGEAFRDTIALTILSNMVYTLVHHKLSTEPSSDPDVASDNYQSYKSLIQQAISTGFENAFSKYTGSSFDYVTQVMPIKNGSKLLC